MKKCLVLLLALVLLLPATAFADVIVEPENSFYRRHQNDCQRQEGRTYLANGPDGTLNVYTAPGGTVTKALENGTAFYCQWTYTDKQGTVWGYSERHEAWAPLGYTLIQYDHIAFAEEYADRIHPQADRTGAEYDTVYLYEYPGSSDPLSLNGVGLTAEKTYTDEQGRRWGFVSYIYGIRNKWFCLDEPASDQLSYTPKDPLPSGYTAPAELPTASNAVILMGVVLGVALITLAAVLIVFRKRRMAA